MKVTKDILSALLIENSYIQTENETFWCIPLKIKGDYWIVATETNIFENKNEIILKLKFNNTVIRFDALVESFIEENGLHSFIYTIKLNYSEDGLDDNKKMFFSMLKELELKHIEWNKRKEERFDIGTNEQRANSLKLKKLEQNLIFNNIQLPCIINNISFSGAKITTWESDFFIDKKLILCLSFIKPIEQIHLPATIKNTSIKTVDKGQIVSILSIKFDSPPLAFKERISCFIEELKK